PQRSALFPYTTLFRSKKLTIVPVLRAGVGMSDGLVELIPSARIGHIGVYRDDQHRPVEYLVRLPDVEDRSFILCDPMVATGYSADRKSTRLNSSHVEI